MKLSFARLRSAVHPALLSLFLTLIMNGVLLAPGNARAEWNWGDNQPDAEWRVLQTEHFRVFYPAEAGGVAVRTSRIAEEAFEPVTALVGGAPPRRIDIVLRDFSDRSSGLAHSVWPRIEIESYMLDRDTETTDFLRQVVIHEFTHVAMYYAVGGEKLELIRAPLALENLPDWWVEGLASATEKPASEPAEEEMVQVAVRSGREPTRHRLDTIRQGDLYDRLLVYRIGESKIRWLVRRFGREAIAAVHHGMRPVPWSFSRALEDAVGMNEAELHEAWLSDIRASYFANPLTDEPFTTEAFLPDVWERPIGAAPLPGGGWALSVVRDEDLASAELIGVTEEGAVTVLDDGPVHADIAVSPDGRIAYARSVRTGGQSLVYDIHVVDPDTKTRQRLTHGARAIRPVWIDDENLAAIAHQRRTGTSALLLIGPGGVERVAHPDTLFLTGPIAVSPARDRLVMPALDPANPGAARFLLLYEMTTREWSRIATDHAPFRPLWSEEGVHVVTRSGAVTRVERVHSGAGNAAAPAPVREASGLVTDVVHGANGEWYAVRADGRYRSSLSWWLRDPAIAARTIRPDPPAWNAFAILPDPPARATALDPGPAFAPNDERYHSVGAIRLRPNPSLSSFGSDRADWEIEDILADPVDLHSLDGSGGARWDGAMVNASATYENRVWLPTWFLDGSYRRNSTSGLPWEERAWSTGAGLRIPVSGAGAFSRTRFGLRIARSGLERSGDEATETSTDWSGALDIRIQRSAPRNTRFFTVEYLRATDGGSRFSRERWRSSAQASRAIFRNDWFLGASIEGLAETGRSKRIVALASPGLSMPSALALGDRAFVWSVDFRYPWSEDLALALGPFWFERLTHRVGYREGRAWQGETNGGEVRSAETDLGLTVFSGHFVPFLGTETTTLRTGYVRELNGNENDEWFFSVETSFYSERWNSMFGQ
ncbi:MAG: hypothetical protein HKN20_10800 [Gemmatimonadetes bacterium]|nr:hypothetical protein [Gemmatimonadota bacterium]